MAAEDKVFGSRPQWLRVPIALAVATVACLLGFWWLAQLPPRHQPVSEASDVAAASAQAESSGASRVSITVMTLSSELTAKQIADFELENPDIHVSFVEYSSNLLDVFIATRDLPDVLRVGAPQHYWLVKSGLLMDITDYISGSKVMSGSEVFEATRHGTVDGRHYGLPMVRETPDFASLYIYDVLFKEAGIPVPSDTDPLTYAELGKILEKLSAKTGKPAYYAYSFERVVVSILAQRGTSLFSPDFSEMRLTKNIKAMEVMRYFYDLAVRGVMYVPPARPGISFLFNWGELPATQGGYWGGATITPDILVYGHVSMIPPPVWDRNQPRVSSYLGGAEMVIAASSKHPDEAYRFIEWFGTGGPAIERARQGWGFPVLNSHLSLLPQETTFDKQRLKIAMDCLKLPSVALPKYPHPSILSSFDQSWIKNIELAIANKISFEEFASNFQEEVNLAIQDDIKKGN